VTQSPQDFAHAWIGLINAGDFDGLRSLYAEDVYADGPYQRIEGADSMVGAVQEWTQAFPDLRGTVNGVHADRTTVAVELTFTGTWSGPMQIGELEWQTPTNQSMTVNACEVMKIEDGKIRASRGYLDMMTVLQQVGAIDAGQE
jgi:steroid delta-isomerase-like uncharacterized protein